MPSLGVNLKRPKDRKSTMRLLSAFAVTATLAGVFLMSPVPGQAQSGNKAWCAMANTGFDNVSELCDFDTFEECRPFVIAGNRGFCERNSHYVAIPAPRHVKRRHHVKSY
ncbi:MAG: hypothetical protein GC182_22300 [Rhodopseudomonas sp.]|nr:hypothetical protein [Rhodopseudomonas sp.]